MKYLKHDICFAVFCTTLLGVFKGGLLHHMEQYSLFPHSLGFLGECLEQPGGLLQYAGAFLTQFCHFPWLGALLVAAVLCMLSGLIRKACRMGEGSWPLAYVPSLMLLLFITRLDCSVYLMSSYGLLFSQSLGLSAAMALLLVHRTWIQDGGHTRLEPAATALTAVVFYPLIGAYAFIASVLMALTSKDRKAVGLGTMVMAAAAAVLVCSYVPGIYERIHRRYLFFAGFPYLDFEDNLTALIPVAAAVLVSAAMPFCGKLTLRPSLAALAAGVVLTGALTNWDRNFKAVLDMEKACMEQDWDKVLAIARKCGSPTRAQVLYRNIALYQEGRLTEDMFTYPDAGEKFRTGAQIPLSYICAVPALHYCGMANSSDRFAMETSATYTKNIFFYKYQAKNALVRGEYDLARKYLTMVAENWFQRGWVRRHMALADSPESIASDSEFAPTLALTGVNSDKFDIVEPLEVMIFRRFSDQDYVNEQIYEWQMACYMMWKDPSNVMYCFLQHTEMMPLAHISEGIAEAAVLYANTSGDAALAQQIGGLMTGHQETLRRFSSFSQSMNRVRNPKAEGVREKIESQHGRSYWTYSVFNEMTAQ